MKQRGIVFRPARTEGFMILLLPMTQGGHDLLLHRTAASEPGPISEILLGVSLCDLSRASSVCLGARKHRRGAPSSTSHPHQKYRPFFALAPSLSQICDSFVRELRLAFVSRLGNSKSWLRQPFFEAYRKISQKLLMRNPVVVLGLTLDVYRCSLARTTGPFSSHSSFWLVQRKRPGKPSPRCTGDRSREPRSLFPPTAASASCKESGLANRLLSQSLSR